MFKKIKEFDKNYSNIFFYFALLIIIVFLVYISVGNRSTEKECKIPNKVVNNYSNYSYNVKFNSSDKNVELFIKRYQTKYLIEKNENGEKTTYYFNYTDLLEKASNGKFIKYRQDEIVEGLDNKFLILDYINDLSLESTLKEDKELTCYHNRKYELSMCINLDNSIELQKDNFKIIYSVIDVGNISDFNVEIDNTYDYELNNNLNSNIIVE